MDQRHGRGEGCGNQCVEPWRKIDIMLGAGVGLPGWARRRRAPRAARAASRRETLLGLPDIGELLARYSELEPGFTDAAIVWLAGRTRCRAFLTVETRDFGIYRIEGGKRFEVVKWFD